MEYLAISSLTLAGFSCIRDTTKLLWECLGDPIKASLCFHKKIKAFQDQLQKLISDAQVVDAAVKEARSKRKVVLKEVRVWQKKVSRVTEEAQVLINQKAKDANILCCCCCFCPGVSSRSSVVKQATQLGEQIKELINRDFVLVTGSPTVASMPPPPLPQTDFIELESRIDAQREVIRALREEGDQFKIVSLYGMPGVGKTSLARHVQLEVLRLGLFKEVALAVVSQTPRLFDIQTQIAESLGMVLPAQTIRVRASQLKERLNECENVLLILDDIWKDLTPDQLGIPSREQIKNNCKILLTTRNVEVSKAMSSPNATITLGPLSSRDAWVLFKQAAGNDVELLELNVVAKKVVKECKGLPIALKTIGKALRGKGLKQWEAAADRLLRSQLGKEVTECIRLSYNFLSENKEWGLQAQKCFLICCLFPEDYNVAVESMVRYGTGLGVFGSGLNMKQIRLQAGDVALHLVDYNLLLPGEKDGSVKMHDVMRDVAIQIVSEGDHKFVVEAGWESDYWVERVTHDCTAISLMFNQISDLPDELPLILNLQLLLLQNNAELKVIPDAFFKNINALKVLDMGHVEITKLPSSLGSLSNLSTLCLDHFKSDSLSSVVGDLKKLQILSLRESQIKTLPEEVGELTGLRILDLTLCAQIHIPHGVISKIRQLEELYMKGSFAKWDELQIDKETGEETKLASIDEVTGLRKLNIVTVDFLNVKCMPKHVNVVPKWEKFNICITDDAVSARWEHHPSTFSRDLLLSVKIAMLPEWLKILVGKTAEKLTYNQSDLDSILIEHDHGDFTDLKFLSIEQCDKIIHLMNVADKTPEFNNPVFKSLKELYIQQISNMETICVGELPQGSFGSLKLLEVRHCDNLVDVLLPPNLLKSFKNLEKLDVSGIPVSQVFGFDDDHGLSEGGYVKGLREMRLHNLPRLTSMWIGSTQTVKFDSLKVVEVCECDELVYLFTLTVSIGLHRLEELIIRNCQAMTEIVVKDGSDQESGFHLFPNLKCLTLRSLKQLTCLYATISLLFGCSSFKLQKEDCPMFKENSQLLEFPLMERNISTRISFADHEAATTSSANYYYSQRKVKHALTSQEKGKGVAVDESTSRKDWRGLKFLSSKTSKGIVIKTENCEH